KDVFGGFQTAWPTHDRRSLPDAGGILARQRGGLQLEINVAGHDDIEQAIAVVVDESATGAPFGAAAGYPRAFSPLLELSVAFIVIQPVLAVVSHVEVIQAVVIVIANADALSPAAGFQSSRSSHIGECAVVIVVIKIAGLPSSPT